MALHTNDEHFRGVLGNKVHFKLNGKYRTRTRVDKARVSQKEVPVTNRLIFEQINVLAAAMQYVITDSFPKRKEGRSPVNEFVRLNRSCCRVDNFQERTMTVDYASLKFSHGRMLPPRVNVTYEEDGHTLTFAISGSTTNYPGCQEDDKVMAVVLNSTYLHAILLELGTRGEGGITSENLDEDWQKDDLHVFVYAINTAGNDVSTSRHLSIG